MSLRTSNNISVGNNKVELNKTDLENILKLIRNSKLTIDGSELQHIFTVIMKLQQMLQEVTK